MFIGPWYQMYPAPTVFLDGNDPIDPKYIVEPGDTISASVTYSIANNTFDMRMTDSGSPIHTVGWTFEAPSVKLPINKFGQRAKLGLAMAEWIVEDPTVGTTKRLWPFGNVGTVSFVGADATINGQTGPIDDPAWQTQQVNMVSNRISEATTSALTPAGTAFTVNYVNTASITSLWASGYQVYTDLVQPAANLITAVSGSWTVPTVSGDWGSEVSEFLGMDGPTSSGAGEWIGTAEYINSETGQPAYAAWYEIYPGRSRAIEITGMTINPGDTMSGSVTYKFQLR